MRKPAKLIIVTGSVLVLASIGVLVFMLVANAPAKASVIVRSVSKSPSYSLNLMPVVVLNHYATFDYPALMTSTPTTLVSGEVAAYTFVHHDVATWNLAVEIYPNNSGLLSGSSAYEYRKLNPQTYQESVQTIHKQTIHTMTDITYGGFNKTAFLVHDNYLATVSLYGDDANGLNAINDTFNMILQSWQWQVN
jgi:hypothetical protein